MEFYRVSPWRSIATLCVVIVLARTTMSFAIAQTGFSPDDVVTVIDGKEYTAKTMDLRPASASLDLRRLPRCCCCLVRLGWRGWRVGGSWS